MTTGEGNGTPLQYSCLENPMDRGAWWAAVHGVAKSWTWLSDFNFHFHALEKAMATHSSVLAWRIPGMGEPGGLLSMGSHRVGHDWSDLEASAAENDYIISGYFSPCVLNTQKVLATSYRVVIVDLPTISCWTFKSEWEGPLGGPVAKTPHSQCRRPRFYPRELDPPCRI